MASKQHWIAGLKRGQSLIDFFAAQDKALATTSDQRRYLRLRLGDRTGWLPAVAWENAEQLFQAFDDGDIVKVMAEVEEFKGRLQLRIRQLRRARADEGVDPADFWAASRFSVPEMLARLDRIVAEVSNPWLRRLLEMTVGERGSARRAFAEAAAAKEVHHAYLGGLLEHVLEMVTLGRALASLHPDYADQDVVTTAIVLHDVGKVFELQRQGGHFAYSREGELLGHIYLGARFVEEQVAHIPQFPPDLREELLHCLLSHHGSLDRGAPVLPRTMNAWIVHLADDASAKLNQVRRLYERIQMGAGDRQGWSEFDQRLGIRAYAGFLQNDYTGDEVLLEPWEPPTPPPAPSGPPGGPDPPAA